MRRIILLLPVLLLLVLASPVQADLGGQELALTPGGEANEINIDSQGVLWVSDQGAGEVWRIDPLAGQASIYALGGHPSDARHDGLGNLWWGDASTGQVGRVSTAGGAAKLWQTPATAGLYGSGLDGAGSLWVTDFVAPFLYNVIPSTNQVCSYELPDFMRSDYLAASGDYVWLGDPVNGRIARLQVSNNNLITWTLGTGSYPEGLALDEQGNPWWADKARGEVGFLDVNANQVITYTQALVQTPQMLSIEAGLIWFTDQATFGVLDPALAPSTTTGVSPSLPILLSPTCQEVLPVDSAPISITAAQSSWAGAVYPQLLNQGGWQVFALPSQGYAWGIAAAGDVWVVDQGRQRLARAADAAPAIQVSKTPSLASVPETGAQVTFTFAVTNTGTVSAVTITGLDDDIFGSLAGDADCQVGTTLAVGAGCQFAITRQVAGDFSGPPHSNTFTAQVANLSQASVAVQASATVSFTNVLPQIAVAKSANPTVVPESGADVAFTFTVQNTSPDEAVTITSLGDSAFGALAGDADCQVGTLLAAGASCQFAITRWVEGDFSGPAHANTFTAKAVDNDGSEAMASAGATVGFTNVLPAIQAGKTVDPQVMPETAGNATFTFTVQNTSSKEAVTITSLSDSAFGPLVGDPGCQSGTVLAAGASCQFSIVRWIVGEPASPHQDTFTAAAIDNDNSQALDSASATVTFTDVPPTIQVAKTASPSVVAQPGGDVTFTFTVTNTSTVDPVTILSLDDSLYGSLAGDVDCYTGRLLKPGTACSFSIIRFVAGNFGDLPHLNTFTAVAADNEGTQAEGADSAMVTFSGPGTSIQVTKTPNPASVPETGGEVTFTFAVSNTSLSEAVTITSLGDSLYGALAGDVDCQVGTQLASGTSCSFSIVRWVEGDYSGPGHSNTFTAHAVDAAQNDLSDSAAAAVSFSNVLPTLQATKTASLAIVPEGGADVTFTFVVQNTSTKEAVTITSLGDSLYGALAGDADCQVNTLLAAGASCQFAITRLVQGDFSGPAHVNVFTARARDNDNSEATGVDDAIVNFSNDAPALLVSKTANPTSVPETGGNVTFTYVVQNTSPGEPVTITSLDDDQFGTLAGAADCQVNTVLAAGASCQFVLTRLVQGDFSGPAHVNVFTAQAKDNENLVASASDDAVVSFTNAAPTLLAVKTADKAIVPETGGIVTFRFLVQNTSAGEAVTITSLSDSVYGALVGDADCQVNTVLAPGAICQFSILRLVRGDFSGPDHINTFTARARDNENTSASASDSAVVDFSNVAPSILATKTASPTAVPETGGNVTFTFVVLNTSPDEAAVITSLSDSLYGTLAGDADCQVNTLLAAGASCQFSLTRWVEGDFSGPVHTNVFTAQARDNENLVASSSDDAVVTFTDVAPAIQVSKTADPAAVPETGGDVTFTFVVQNTSASEPVTILSLEDSVYGALDGDADCQVGTLLAAGTSCQFSIIRQVSGSSSEPPHVNVFTAVAEDNDGTQATDSDQASVTLTNYLLAIEVTKSASLASVPESGGEVTFTFTVKNISTDDAVTISELSDSAFGALAGDADCQAGTLLALGASCSFSLTRSLQGDFSGPVHTNTFTARAIGPQEVTATDQAMVAFSDVPPTVTVLKTPSVDSVPASGAEVTFTFTVTNTSLEAVTILGLTDSIYGPLDGDADCQVSTLLAAGASCEFSVVRLLSGSAGHAHTNVFTVEVKDNDNSTATASDDATVTFTSEPTQRRVYLPLIVR